MLLFEYSDRGRGINSISSLGGGVSETLPCETGYYPVKNEIYNNTYLKQQKRSCNSCQMVKDSTALQIVQFHLLGVSHP